MPVEAAHAVPQRVEGNRLLHNNPHGVDVQDHPNSTCWCVDSGGCLHGRNNLDHTSLYYLDHNNAIEYGPFAPKNSGDL